MSLALRCCTSRWRNFWTSGVALREEASNHLPGPWLKTVVLSGVGKGAAVTVSGVGRKDERWANCPVPTEASKANQTTPKPGLGLCSGMSLEVTRFLSRWCPAYRQHESGPGSRMEHVKARTDTAIGESVARGRTPSGRIRKELSTVAGRAGGLTRSSCEVPTYRSGGGAKGWGRPG